jgi:ABC-2 type transport system ATP-binding protein
MESSIDKDYFKTKGVKELKIDGNIVTFLFKGNINAIMKKFGAIEISNVWIEEPDLEEIFMHYYEKEE